MAAHHGLGWLPDVPKPSDYTIEHPQVAPRNAPRRTRGHPRADRNGPRPPAPRPKPRRSPPYPSRALRNRPRPGLRLIARHRHLRPSRTPLPKGPPEARPPNELFEQSDTPEQSA